MIECYCLMQQKASVQANEAKTEGNKLFWLRSMRRHYHSMNLLYQTCLNLHQIMGCCSDNFFILAFNIGMHDFMFFTLISLSFVFFFFDKHVFSPHSFQQ